jgi:hypothetical protein
MSIENMSKTVEPKSDQLNADDLIAGSITVTVSAITDGASPDQPVDLHIGYEGRPYKPCKSMRRVLIACWGNNGHDWVGKSMTLYNDPSVRFGGSSVGGIRISHLSDIGAAEKRLLLTTTRSKRAEYIVKCLDITPYPSADFAANSAAWMVALQAGKITIPELMAKTAKKGKLTSEQTRQLTLFGEGL